MVFYLGNVSNIVQTLAVKKNSIPLEFKNGGSANREPNDDYCERNSGSTGGYQRALDAVCGLDVLARAGDERQRGPQGSGGRRR
jgi:hypothetical protein